MVIILASWDLRIEVLCECLFGDIERDSGHSDNTEELAVRRIDDNQARGVMQDGKRVLKSD